MLTFKQGEEVKLEIPILESNGAGLQSTPATLTGVTKVIASLFISNQEMPIKYSLEVQTGFGKLELGTAANAHVASLYIESYQSQDFPTGKLQVAVAVFYPDLDFPDGNRKKEYLTEAALVDVGKTKSITGTP